VFKDYINFHRGERKEIIEMHFNEDMNMSECCHSYPNDIIPDVNTKSEDLRNDEYMVLIYEKNDDIIG